MDGQNFPHILVLNLDERTDRWEQIQDNFKGWPALERVQAVKASPGWKGCLKSHINAIKIAKSRNYPWVLVLEDDCVVGKHSLQQFKSLLPSLWERKAEWNVFLGGTTILGDDITLIQKSPPILKVQAYTAHFCIYNSNVYDLMIEKSITDEKQVDVIIRDYATIYCTAPHIAIQRPGKSDIEDKITDYNVHFIKSQTSLQKMVSSGDSNMFWNKLIIANLVALSLLFVIAKKYIR